MSAARRRSSTTSAGSRSTVESASKNTRAGSRIASSDRVGAQAGQFSLPGDRSRKPKTSLPGAPAARFSIASSLSRASHELHHEPAREPASSHELDTGSTGTLHEPFTSSHELSQALARTKDHNKHSTNPREAQKPLPDRSRPQPRVRLGPYPGTIREVARTYRSRLSRQSQFD